MADDSGRKVERMKWLLRWDFKKWVVFLLLLPLNIVCGGRFFDLFGMWESIGNGIIVWSSQRSSWSYHLILSLPHLSPHPTLQPFWLAWQFPCSTYPDSLFVNALPSIWMSPTFFCCILNASKFPGFLESFSDTCCILKGRYMTRCGNLRRLSQ